MAVNKASVVSSPAAMLPKCAPQRASAVQLSLRVRTLTGRRRLRRRLRRLSSPARTRCAWGDLSLLQGVRRRFHLALHDLRFRELERSTLARGPQRPRVRVRSRRRLRARPRACRKPTGCEQALKLRAGAAGVCRRPPQGYKRRCGAIAPCTGSSPKGQSGRRRGIHAARVQRTPWPRRLARLLACVLVRAPQSRSRPQTSAHVPGNRAVSVTMPGRSVESARDSTYTG